MTITQEAAVTLVEESGLFDCDLNDFETRLHSLCLTVEQQVIAGLVERAGVEPCYHMEWDELGFGKAHDYPTDASVPGYGNRAIASLQAKLEAAQARAAELEKALQAISKIDATTTSSAFAIHLAKSALATAIQKGKQS